MKSVTKNSANHTLAINAKSILLSLALISSIYTLMIPASFSIPSTNSKPEEHEKYFSRTCNDLKCTLDRFPGIFPTIICFLIHQLAHSISDPECCINAILLHGPFGTGKTTITQIIARSARAELITHIGTSKDIDETLEEVDEALENGKRVVLFFDDFNILDTTKNKGAYKVFLKMRNSIKKHVEEKKGNARLLIVVATHEIKLLDPAFLSLFKLIKVDLPNQEMCEQILSYHLSKYQYNPKLNMRNFAQELHRLEMSGRDIERIVLEARMRSKMSGAPMILIAAMEDAMQEIVEQKKKILEEERKKEHQEERSEEIAELNYRMTKQRFDESLKTNILRRNQELRNPENDDDDDDESILSWATKKIVGS